MLPAEIDEITNKILSRYKAVDTELKRRQRLVMDAPSEERARRRLVDLRKQLAADLKTLEADTRSWIEGDFPGIYTLGASSSAASLGIAASFTQTRREAFSRLAVDTFDDLLTATSFVADDAKRWIRDVAAERTRFVVAGGQTARQGGREMARQLERAVKPISAIRYKDGSLHSIGEYSEVVLRTKTAVAYNTGSLDVFDTAGVAYVEIFDGSDCHLLSHKDGPLANGLIVPATTAREHPIAHPNCRRSFGARPDIESPEDLASAKSTERTPTGFRAAAPRSPEPAVTSGRSSRTPRSQREQRRPRSEASGTAPSTARPAISDIEAAAARHGVTVDEIELHRPAVKELRRAVADEAARTQREAFELLDRSGALRVQRPARIASQRGGEYDWYTGLGDREKARLSRRWFSDSSVDSPDVLADRLRADLGARFASYTDGELMEEVWLPATERIEASGALRQGKLPSLRGYSSSFDVDSLIPELSGQGYSARALLADDLDAAAHIARVNRERFAEEAYRMLGPAANPVEGPGVFEMGFQSWEAEVRDLEHLLQNTRDPARTVLRRYDELVPFDLDAEGLTYEELYARIIETSRLAGKEVSAHAVVPWT